LKGRGPRQDCMGQRHAADQHRMRACACRCFLQIERPLERERQVGHKADERGRAKGVAPSVRVPCLVVITAGGQVSAAGCAPGISRATRVMRHRGGLCGGWMRGRCCASRVAVRILCCCVASEIARKSVCQGMARDGSHRAIPHARLLTMVRVQLPADKEITVFHAQKAPAVGVKDYADRCVCAVLPCITPCTCLCMNVHAAPSMFLPPSAWHPHGKVEGAHLLLLPPRVMCRNRPSTQRGEGNGGGGDG